MVLRSHREIQNVNLDKIQEFIDSGRLRVPEKSFITMRDLVVCGLVTQLKDGIKLTAGGKEVVSVPMHLEVSQASKEAIAAIEKNGGTVTCTHFNKLALRVLLKPYKFELMPRRARPPPKLMEYYLDKTKCGYLSPEIQLRNLSLFGCVTSESSMIEEHEKYMSEKRALGLVTYK